MIPLKNHSNNEEWEEISLETTDKPISVSKSKEEVKTFSFKEVDSHTVALLDSQNLNAFATTNFSDLATSNRRWEKVYKVAAVITLIVGAVLLIGLIVTVSVLTAPLSPILSPILAGVAFIVGMSVYKGVFHNKIFAHFKEKAIEAKQHAQIFEGYQEYINQAECIDLQSQKNIEGPEKQLLGIYNFWMNKYYPAEGSLKELQKHINEITEQLKAELPAAKRVELSKQRTLLMMKHHRIQESELLPAKLHAAYFCHLEHNPTDTRSLQDFGKMTPVSYQTSLELSSRNESHLFWVPNNPNIGEVITNREVLELDIESLKQKMFTNTIGNSQSNEITLDPYKVEALPTRTTETRDKKVQSLALQFKKKYGEKFSDEQYQFFALSRYWYNLSETLKEKIGEHEEKIERVRQLISDEKTSPTDKEKLLAHRSKLMEEKHRLESGEYLPAKVNAAYFLYRATYTSDTRGSTEFGTLNPVSYTASLENRLSEVNHDYFTFGKGIKGRNISKSSLMGLPVQKIAARIFESNKKKG